MISPGQIRMARALLEWSQDTLAVESGVSPNTINKVENGENITFSRLAKIRESLERKNIEFSENDGVSRRSDTHIAYDGTNGCEKFYDDLLSTVKEKGGEIIAIFRSPEVLARALGVVDFNKLDRLECLSKYATVKCALLGTSNISLAIPFFEFKAIPQRVHGFLSSITYGNKHAVIIQNSKAEFYYFIVKSAQIAFTDRTEFSGLWDSGFPLIQR